MGILEQVESGMEVFMGKREHEDTKYLDEPYEAEKEKEPQKELESQIGLDGRVIGTNDYVNKDGSVTRNVGSNEQEKGATKAPFRLDWSDSCPGVTNGF